MNDLVFDLSKALKTRKAWTRSGYEVRIDKFYCGEPGFPISGQVLRTAEFYTWTEKGYFFLYQTSSLDLTTEDPTLKSEGV